MMVSLIKIILTKRTNYHIVNVVLFPILQLKKIHIIELPALHFFFLQTFGTSK